MISDLPDFVKVKLITPQDLISANSYIECLEEWIRGKSHYYKLMNKYTTGFGLYGNLYALLEKKLINQELAKDIKNSYDFFYNLEFKFFVNTHDWNEHVVLQQNILSALN